MVHAPSSSDTPLATSNARSAITGASQNSSIAPINQNATGNGPQAPKKKKRKNKKNKNNNAGGNGGQPGPSQTNQNAPQPGGSQQLKQKPAQVNKPPQEKKPQQPRPANAQNQNTRPNFGINFALPFPLPKPAPPPPPPVFTKFNDFPLEIQKHIFEIAYLTSYGDPDKWVLVSRKVKEWIEPYIYESIVLPSDFGGGDRRLELYERTFRLKPKEFYTKNVQRIFTNNNLRRGSNFELELLQICDNLVSLECWSDAREELTTILKTKTWPKLKTLCINIDLLPKDENTFHLPLFKYVTHLDFTSNDPQLPSWESLKSLDNLNHMRVYMISETKSKDFRVAMDQVYAIATEARKCFPPNLKHFVILAPVDILFRVCNMEHDTPEDEQRWKRMESIRFGTFDPRIMLGCSGDWDNWLDGGQLSDVDEDSEASLVLYAQVVPLLNCPIWPRDHFGELEGGEGEMDPWQDVLEKDKKRKAFLASRKK